MVETKTPRKKNIESMKKHTAWVVVFCCLMLVIVYWHHTDQMTLSAALPSMCACSMCAGVHIGSFQKERE